MSNAPKVCIVGGGMITQVQLLPTIYDLQRKGVVGDISICALDSGPLKVLAEDPTLLKGFPGQNFDSYPALDTSPDEKFPDIYKEVIADLPKRSIVVVAVPDQLHNNVVQVALEHDQHICCVKPLVLKHDDAVAIEKSAYDKGLAIGIEYHKRFDDRSLIARRKYRAGDFGELRLGQAMLHECWYYRHSNFQNWCTCENSDMFSYIGCHYVDLVHYITGLLPKSVSVYGMEEAYPNGNMGYLWTDGRVIWENGACLNVQNSFGYPDDGPGGNIQGMRLYGGTGDMGTMIVHSDQFRGVEHAYTHNPGGPGETIYNQPNPDYFQYLDLGTGGLVPTGYGYRSIAYIVDRICECINETDGLDEDAALTRRRELIKRFDEDGIMATPANSSYNELVMEAGRLSILNGGREVEIQYGEDSGVSFKVYG
ncbi:MAG: Gfo/Idh/MocA family oxidoreductase [Kiritimatiellae bacterium]|nr:Gfo/Idh/MocA family oxidoreductase [Kiritimatiellia bacterium]